MMIVRFITLFCGLFIAESILLAQSGRITFERIDTEQGLSHLTVTDIIQDRRGFFWFTTLDGRTKGILPMRVRVVMPLR